MHLPPVTQALIGLNIVGFSLQQLLGPWVTMTFALWPPVPVMPGTPCPSRSGSR